MAAILDYHGRCLDFILFSTRERDGFLISRDEFPGDCRLPCCKEKKLARY